jgi:CubicO group peptidase (beta-lactamase class C family)
VSEGSQFMGYGYLWWILRPDPSGEKGENIYAAIGLNAQYIFIVPEHDMVIIVTGGTRTKEAMYKPVDFLYSDVLSAVRH